MQQNKIILQHNSVKNNKNQNIKYIYHFKHTVPLPQTCEFIQYQSKFNEPNKKSKLKHKYDKFTYYKDIKTNEIIKILFINENQFIDQGKYPFTEPLGNIGKFSDLSVKRVKTTEAAYIGHLEENVIVKKMQGVRLGENGEEFQTIDDKFQTLKISNKERFKQFLKLMSLNQHSISISIRVIIQEQEGKAPQIIDYEFFYREQQLIKSKKIKLN